MDATRAPRWVLAAVLLVTCGCTWDYQAPTARQEIQAPPEAQEPPQVVDSPRTSESKTTGSTEVEQTVLGWVDRIDHVERRGTRQEPRSQDNVGPIRYALDIEPTTTRPAEAPSTESVSEEPAESQPSPPPVEPASSRPAPAGPPTLSAVTVRAAEATTTPTPRSASTPEPFEPSVNAPARAADAPASLRDLIDRLPPAAEGSFRAQLDQRMLWVIAGDHERARSPLVLVTAEQQELATRFIDAWIAVRDWHPGDQAAAASAAARELDALQEALRRLSDLSVPVVRVCRSVRGYGQYDAIEPPRFRAGQDNEFVLYCELRDFVSERRDDGLYTTAFDLTTTILDRGGQVVLEIKDTDLVDRCANRRHDCFIPRLVRLPASLSPGAYVAKTTVIDKLGQKVAENRAAFELAADP